MTKFFARNLAGSLVLLAATALFSARTTAQVPTGFGTTPTFDEEFNETGLNTNVWSYRDLGQTRGDCVVAKQGVSVQDGHLRVAIYDGADGTHYCGSVSTDNTFEQKYGYWEASVRYQYQPGITCSFWVQADTTGYYIGAPQKSGVEMDIFEHTSFATANSGDRALHWNGYNPAFEGTANDPYTSTALTDGNYHLYGLAWTPANYTFYVDGVVQWTVPASTAPISDIVQYLIVDTNLLPNDTSIPTGGYGPLGSTSNAYIDVDYIRVYPYSATPTTSLLPATANAYVRDGSYADTNFGGANGLTVKGDSTGYNRNSYLMFDLSGLTGTVQQATLLMTPNAVGTTTPIVDDIFLTSSTWTESGITWNNAPAASGAHLSWGTNFPLATSGAPYQAFYDVTQAAIAKAGQPLSLLISPNPPNYIGSSYNVGYASKEDPTASSHPVLMVITTP